VQAARALTAIASSAPLVPPDEHGRKGVVL